MLSLHEVAVRESVKNADADPDEVEFIELSLGEMEAALQSGQADAIATAEPFLGVAMNNGAELIASQYVDIHPEFIPAMYLATEQTTAEDTDLVEQFNTALQRSMEHSTENPEELRAQLDEFTEIDPGVAEEMILTTFGWGLPEDTVSRIAEVSADAGVIDDPDATAEGLLSYISGE